MDSAIAVTNGGSDLINTTGHPHASKQSTSNLSRWYTPGSDYGYFELPILAPDLNEIID